MNYPQEIQDYAKRMIANGTKMSFEAICEMKMKSIKKSEKAFKKFAKKDVVLVVATKSAYELNQEGIMKNLPSSLRK